jgi:hypothetical protein
MLGYGSRLCARVKFLPADGRYLSSLNEYVRSNLEGSIVSSAGGFIDHYGGRNAAATSSFRGAGSTDPRQREGLVVAKRREVTLGAHTFYVVCS